MPSIEFVRINVRFAQGRGVDEKVIIRIMKALGNFPKHRPHHITQMNKLIFRHFFKMSMTFFRKNPNFIRRLRNKRTKCNEILVFVNDSLFFFRFPINHHVIYSFFIFFVKFLGSVQAPFHVRRQYGYGYNLRMRMPDARSGPMAVIVEYQRIFTQTMIAGSKISLLINLEDFSKIFFLVVAKTAVVISEYYNLMHTPAFVNTEWTHIFQRPHLSFQNGRKFVLCYLNHPVGLVLI